MKHTSFFGKQIRPWLGGICFLFLYIASPGALWGQQHQKLKISGLFQDHMVLQRGKPIKIKGQGPEGQEVGVELRKVKTGSLERRKDLQSQDADAVEGSTTRSAVTSVGADGKWEVALKPLPAGGPYELLASTAREKVLLQDILLGDVWIASGQSNMEWPIKATGYTEVDSSWMKEAQIRLLKVHPEMDYKPRHQSTNQGWKQLNLETMTDFSAVAYHFGKQLERERGIPIGLISANLGATTIETWMSNETLASLPQFEDTVEQLGSFSELRKAFQEGHMDWSKEQYYSGPGMEEQWFLPAVQDSLQWKSIEVAGNTWEEVEELKDFDGAVWFRKKFALPQDFEGDSLQLSLLQIDDYDIAWVNGKRIGETFGRYNHRNYKVSVDQLKEKDNLLVVRVFDTGGIGGFTTNAFWGNELLWGTWEYQKGKEIVPADFKGPTLPNVSPFSSPGVLYNGSIAPLTAFGIKGVIWYQGESNELRAYEYSKLFPALIRDWRKQFGQGDFPFLFVQLANYRAEAKQPGPSAWAELREAQTSALKEPHTGMAVAIDLGEAQDIHPKNKEDVGKRLAGLALKMCYGSTELVQSPQFREMKIGESKAILEFDHIGAGFQNKNKHGYIRGFQVAGADGKFYWAQARLQGNQVIVESDKVKKPVAVRYAWSDNPGGLDLYNAAGLPLAPFRTDEWELSTEGKVFEDGPRF